MSGSLLRTYSVFLCLIFSTAINATIINGSNVIDVYGKETQLKGYDNSKINVYAGSKVSWLYGYDAANINISGGDISWLTLYNQSVSNITAVDDLSWLLVNDSSEVNIFGSGFSYANGHLSGLWGNGSSFDFWALKESDLSSGNVSSVLPDNIRLHSVSVPEPGTPLLFLIGLAITLYTAQFKSNKDIRRKF